MMESFRGTMQLALLDRTKWKAEKSWLTLSSNGRNAGITPNDGIPTPGMLSTVEFETRPRPPHPAPDPAPDVSGERGKLSGRPPASDSGRGVRRRNGPQHFRAFAWRVQPGPGRGP